MDSYRRWVLQRRYTFALTIFLAAWFIGQLAVKQAFGEAVAEWWFYWNIPETFPQQEYSPGILLAPISHHMNRLTHIGGNLPLLVLLGVFIEPRIGGKKLISIVVGLSAAGIFIANSTALLHGSWVYVGISGGVFGLMAYIGVTNANLIVDLFRVEEPDIGTVEWIYCSVCLVSTFLIPPYEALMFGFNSGHTVGILLGILTAYIGEY